MSDDAHGAAKVLNLFTFLSTAERSLSVEGNRFLRIPQNFNDTGVNFSSNISDTYTIESKAKQRLALNANSRRTLKE